MKLHELSPVPGSHKKPKRLGQGLGSGNGKTAGKGHKGQKARKSPDIKANFEGGQMPLARRIPKRGFSNFRFTVKYEIVNIADLEERFEAGSEVTAKELSELRLISAPDRPVKVLGVGELSKSLNVKANAYSASAAKKIEASPEQLAMRKAELTQLYSNPEQTAFISGLEQKFGAVILKDEYKPGYKPSEEENQH